MAYQPIKIIAEEQTTDGHVNRETSFDSTPQSNKINYQTGLPLITATPKSLGGKGPRRVDLNGLFYLFSSNLFELQQGHFPTYNSAIVGTGKPLPDGYPLGAVLWYPTGGYFVKSLVANNTESDLSDINSWEKITISAADLLQAVPTGSIQPYAGTSIPSGWLLCDGSAVSRTDYAALFAAIGTLYGTGDESTTFNLPDFINKTFWGGTPNNDANTGITELSAGLPNITGATTSNYSDLSTATGSFLRGTDLYNRSSNVGGLFGANLNFDASLSNSIYGNSTTVQPPAIRTPFIIKY